MRVVLIEPASQMLHLFHRFRFPRLGTVLLATILKRLGHDAEAQVEVAAPLDFAALGTADLVGISTITPTATRCYAIADMLRRSGLPVVLGGPHVTFQTEEGMEHADYVVRGEGEAALTALVKAIENGGRPDQLRAVPNLTWRSPDGHLVNNPLAPFVDLETLPNPDWSVVRAGVGQTGMMSHRTAGVQTSRGCPHGCTFCSVNDLFGRKIRYASVDSVIEAIRPHNQRGNVIFFYDDNFAVNRERVGTICEAILSAGLTKMAWSAQVRAEVARDAELIKLMRRSGACTFYIGLESAHEESLKRMKKHQSVAMMRDDLKAIHKAGIRVHGMFVLGFDADTPASVRATVDFATKERLSSAQFLLLIPLPGTDTYKNLRAQGRIVLQDWSLFDGHHTVFQPQHFSMRDLQQAQLDAHAQFYSRGRQLGWMLKGKLIETLLYPYARHLNNGWQKENGKFLSWLSQLDLLKAIRDVVPARASPAIVGPALASAAIVCP